MRRMVGENVARMTYGFTSYNSGVVGRGCGGGGEGERDYIEMAERAQKNFSLAATPNTYWVDILPFCTSSILFLSRSS